VPQGFPVEASTGYLTQTHWPRLPPLASPPWNPGSALPPATSAELHSRGSTGPVSALPALSAPPQVTISGERRNQPQVLVQPPPASRPSIRTPPPDTAPPRESRVSPPPVLPGAAPGPPSRSTKEGPPMATLAGDRSRRCIFLSLVMKVDILPDRILLKREWIEKPEDRAHIMFLVVWERLHRNPGLRWEIKKLFVFRTGEGRERVMSALVIEQIQAFIHGKRACELLVAVSNIEYSPALSTWRTTLLDFLQQIMGHLVVGHAPVTAVAWGLLWPSGAFPNESLAELDSFVIMECRHFVLSVHSLGSRAFFIILNTLLDYPRASCPPFSKVTVVIANGDLSWSSLRPALSIAMDQIRAGFVAQAPQEHPELDWTARQGWALRSAEESFEVGIVAANHDAAFWAKEKLLDEHRCMTGQVMRTGRNLEDARKAGKPDAYSPAELVPILPGITTLEITPAFAFSDWTIHSMYYNNAHLLETVGYFVNGPKAQFYERTYTVKDRYGQTYEQALVRRSVS
ncbi:hypothetical protein KFL_016000010, partial [Klebsormidium nitens]